MYAAGHETVGHQEAVVLARHQHSEHRTSSRPKCRDVPAVFRGIVVCGDLTDPCRVAPQVASLNSGMAATPQRSAAADKLPWLGPTVPEVC
jgi:hypothetical protein